MISDILTLLDVKTIFEWEVPSWKHDTETRSRCCCGVSGMEVLPPQVPLGPTTDFVEPHSTDVTVYARSISNESSIPYVDRL